MQLLLCLRVNVCVCDMQRVLTEGVLLWALLEAMDAT